MGTPLIFECPGDSVHGEGCVSAKRRTQSRTCVRASAPYHSDNACNGIVAVVPLGTELDMNRLLRLFISHRLWGMESWSIKMYSLLRGKGIIIAGHQGAEDNTRTKFYKPNRSRADRT